ncbi:MAG: type VI secretion system contractile sheath large subunit [Acidobacteria bacterium]|nr:type VI secretion system contractile sheath large subunit [Acidobacteriota bacterium]
MPRPAYADVHLEVDPKTPLAKRERVKEREDSETPFRILVLGDFSGRASRGILTKGPRRPIAIDRDNFEDVLDSLQVEVRLPVTGGDGIGIRIVELDDFHPDRLYQRLDVFRKLRVLREELDDPATFAAAAKQLGIQTSAPKAAAPVEPPVKPSTGSAAGSLLSGSLLDQAMEATETRGAPGGASRSADPLANYVRELVAPHLVPKPDAKKKEVIQMVDAAVSGAMGDVLHHPYLQELEATWRGLYYLVRELETGPKLKVLLLDISREELDADVAGADDLRTTVMHRILVEQTVRTPGAHPWALVVGAYSFGPGMGDLNLLGRMGLLARMANAPFVASGSPMLLGCASLAAAPYPEDWKPGPEREGWSLIRSLPEARHLGLVLPRFLLRMPYGKAGESTEMFDFQEMPVPPKHEWYLWGNGAFLCATLLGHCFSEAGWQMDGTEVSALTGFPIHTYKENGEAKMTPSTEVFLSGMSVEKIHETGLMALCAIANRDEVRIAGFRSVSSSSAALEGRWG